jgi:hypothetical protein
VRALKRHGRVRDLVLSSASMLTDRQISDVGRLSSLTRLELIDMPLISFDWAKTLSNLVGLTSLTIDTRGHDVETSALFALRGLTGLTSLTIESEGALVSEEGLLALRFLTGLTSLRLRGSAIACTDDVLVVVSELSLLKTLDIRVSPLATAACFASLTKLELVEELHLRLHWSNFGYMQHDPYHTGVRVLDRLSGFRALERVSLACDGCIHHTLKAFGQLPTLKHMDVTFTSGVRRDLNDLLSPWYRRHGSGDPALPLLSVHYSYDPPPQ